MAFNNYSTGTVSIGAGATSIVGSGSNWSGVNAKPGDDIVVAGNTVIVQDVVNATTLTIDPWPYAAVAAGTAYKIVQRSPLRYAGGQAMADVSTLVGALNTDGFYVFVPSIATVPDPSYGNDGQYAFQASTGKLWVKASGAWSYLGVYKGFSFRGAYSGTTAYGVNDVVTYNNGSYIATAPTTGNLPTNVAYWGLLAAAGVTGATGPAALKPVASWLTATAYVAGPPADYVTINGSSYQCLVAHTSGTFATDLAAGKWGLVAQAGVNAPTYGGTSTTSLAIGTGAKALTTQTGLAYTNGARVRASSNANAANYMEGPATYSGTTLTITVDRTGGSGTFADWNLNIAGQPGAGSGDVQAANNLSEYTATAATARVNIGINQCTVMPAAQNFNLINAPGTYLTVDTASVNSPTADVYYLEVMTYSAGGGYVTQRATNVYNGLVYIRTANAAAWTPWKQVQTLDTGYITGQCKLLCSSPTLLTLNPFNGRSIRINGVVYQLPATPPTVSNAGLAGSSLYYVYAYVNAGAVALTMASNGHSIDGSVANYGTEIMTGDPTRTLVGMVWTNSAAQFTDNVGSRLVRSWFNDNGVSGTGANAGVVSTSSTSPVEIDTACRSYAVLWAGEQIDLKGAAQAFSNVAGQIAYTNMAVNNVAGGVLGFCMSAIANYQAEAVPMWSTSASVDGLYQFSLLMFSSGNGSTANYASKATQFSTIRK